MVGDWRGEDTAQSIGERLEIEVILDGPPGARSGTYHYVSLTQSALTDIGNRRLDWTDRWQMRTVVVNGQPMQFVHLENLVGPRIGDYVLTSNNVLVPQFDLRRIDLSPNALRVSLYPVPRGTFGYGRA